MKKITLSLVALTSTIVSSMSFADVQSGNWLIRVRGIDVVPYANSNIINTIGGRVNSISTQVVPELDINYFLTNHLSTELILATSKHYVSANNTSLGRVSLGSVYLLPPTLTLQYHFLPDSHFNPYVGAGVNYTYFYNTDSGPVATSINYSNSFGPAFQAGVDYMIDCHWSINLDVKKIFIESIVNANTTVGNLNPDVKINPIVIGMGVGYRF